jgi:hypothetical protein
MSPSENDFERSENDFERISSTEAGAALDMLAQKGGYDYIRRGPPQPPSPWLLIDLDPVWVTPEGVADDVSDEIKQRALRAFRQCTTVDEWIYAFNEPEMGAGPTYRFWPHRSAVEGFVPWPVSFFPDGDDQAFVSQDFAWGVYAYATYEQVHYWTLYVFGQRLLDAFVGHWPRAWSNVLDTKGEIPRSLLF